MLRIIFYIIRMYLYFIVKIQVLNNMSKCETMKSLTGRVMIKMSYQV